jgi:hypothetical protein
MSRQTVKNGEYVPETQPTTFSSFVWQEDPGAHVNGSAVQVSIRVGPLTRKKTLGSVIDASTGHYLQETPDVHPQVMSFSQLLLLVAARFSLSNSSTRSDSDTEPGAGVGFGVQPLVPSEVNRPVSRGGGKDPLPTRFL